MDRTARTLLPYGVIVAEYLLAAGVLYGGVLLLRPAVEAHTCVDSCFPGLFLLLVLIGGLMVLSVGLLVGLVVLTVRLRRARDTEGQLQTGKAVAGAATDAAVTGLVSGLASLPILYIGGLLLLKFTA
jgi:hypothetical protein